MVNESCSGYHRLLVSRERYRQGMARSKDSVRAPLFQISQTTAMIQPLTGITPYVRWGDYAFLTLLGLVLLAARTLSLLRAMPCR